MKVNLFYAIFLSIKFLLSINLPYCLQLWPREPQPIFEGEPQLKTSKKLLLFQLLALFEFKIR